MKNRGDLGSGGHILALGWKMEVAIAIAMFQSCKRCSELAVLEMHLE